MNHRIVLVMVGALVFSRIALAASACPATTFGDAEPESQGVNVERLLKLTDWVRDNPKLPVLSILISKNGHVVYRMLTSSLSGEEAHYLMSATKSVTSALVGVAIDHGNLKGPEQSLDTILPPRLFPSEESRKKFSAITIKDVLGMSALDAPVEPHQMTPEARKRLQDWLKSPNRVAFALRQPLLARPGTDFFYTDITTSLASGIVEYSTHESLLDYANQNLFNPMGFAHQEWMHEDPAGIDNGGFGLRLRPIDMQKFGFLYLNDGCWNGKRLISSDWAHRSFSSWISSRNPPKAPDYGWSWWNVRWAPGWRGHGAHGWRGQRIEVFPEKKYVVTMTAILVDDSEYAVFAKLIRDFVVHLDDPLPKDANVADLKAKLREELRVLQTSASRIVPGTQTRMIPSVEPREKHIPFQ